MPRLYLSVASQIPRPAQHISNYVTSISLLFLFVKGVFEFFYGKIKNFIFFAHFEQLLKIFTRKIKRSRVRSNKFRESVGELPRQAL